MNAYWKTFWDRYVEEAEDDPFSQVGRTLDKQPMSKVMFLKTAAFIIEKLELEAHHVVLDLCCGNGLFSAVLAPRCQRVVGVDFSEKFIADMKVRAPKNVTALVRDALEVEFQTTSFHRILFAAALQQFTQAQVIRFFKALFRWLKPGGILLVTDILDAQRIWDYYNSQEREDVYFQRTMEEAPVLGTWLDRLWLEKLARHAGFSQAQALDQPDDYWYAHYRFDLFCRK